MTPALLGKKVGMTRVYDEKGTIVPVTVVECQPNAVTQMEDARSSPPLRRDEAAVLVEADRAQGEVELLGQLSDGPRLVLAVRHGGIVRWAGPLTLT